MTDKTESLIDLVFTNAPFNITMNDVYALSFSDHDLIGCNCKQNRVKTPQKIMRCRNYRLYDHNKLKNTDWSPLYISHSISDLLQAFNRILTEFFERHAPFATTKTNTNISPWLTVKLKKRNELQDVLQDVLLRKFYKSKTTEKYEKYKRQRNKVNNQIKRAKQNYNKNLLDENTKNAAAFWRILKSIFPTKSKLKLTSTTFNVNEEETLNKETIANGFGQFFSNIATILHLIKDFVRNKSKNLPIRTTQKLFFRTVKNLQCLKKLRSKKAHKIDELPPNLFKDVTNKISKPLAFIINKSLSLDIAPDLWKISPLYKSDSKSDFSDCRAISLLPCLSKVPEQVVTVNYQIILKNITFLKASNLNSIHEDLRN